MTGRRVLRPLSLPTGLTPETITPSSLHGKAREAAGGNRVDVTYGEPLTLAIPGVEDAMEKGKILHRAFEVLSDHPERRGLLPDALGQALPVGVALSPEQGDAIFAAVAAFDAWLKDSLSPQSRQAEVPLLALNEAGSVVHGFADMIVETADGLWIVDHKSDFVPTPEQMSERFDTYFPQVRCYADALGRARPDKPVRGVVLNWVSFGRVSLEEF
ncbi:MAG: hypothetical protein FIB02_06335 [Desulfuromonas sp.]|nr:hypothetical protein [Desulfuromonas sp.]